MDTNCVELTYRDGSFMTIDCEGVENFYGITTGQMADLNWLVYHAPMEYAGLVLSGEPGRYLRGAAEHGLEDETFYKTHPTGHSGQWDVL